MFGLTAALVHPVLGRLSSRIKQSYFLFFHNWGMAVMLLIFPHVSSITTVYILQAVLGILGAMNKHSEKTLIANLTEGIDRAKYIGNYHFWTSIFSAFAIMIGGFLADYFTIHLIFYSASFLFFISGLSTYKLNEKK